MSKKYQEPTPAQRFFTKTGAVILSLSLTSPIITIFLWGWYDWNGPLFIGSISFFAQLIVFLSHPNGRLAGWVLSLIWPIHLMLATVIFLIVNIMRYLQFWRLPSAGFFILYMMVIGGVIGLCIQPVTKFYTNVFTGNIKLSRIALLIGIAFAAGLFGDVSSPVQRLKDKTYGR